MINLDILSQIGLYGSAFAIAIMTILQIAPIKVNPWSWVAKAIGRAINSEVLEEVKTLRQDVQHNKEDDDEQWASLSRTHILRFGDELLHGVGHSKEHFEQILLDISKYERYCDNHPEYLNGVATATIKQIKNTYQRCLEENSFL